MSNVCRSPTAEAVLRKLIARSGLTTRIEVCSAGTHGYRAGDACDANNLRRLATAEQLMRIRLIKDYATHFTENEVPDPYLTLGGRFELVLEMIEDAASGLIEEIRRQFEPVASNTSDTAQGTLQR